MTYNEEKNPIHHLNPIRFNTYNQRAESKPDKGSTDGLLT